jgi:AcrR family transcriptional regulator
LISFALNSEMEKTDTRRSILIIAEKLFSELGYEGTSTRQISKEAGVNLAMINYYFGSKEGVFMEIVKNRIQDFNLQLKSINEDQAPPLEKLLLVVESYANRILANIPFHRMMQRELSLVQRPEMVIEIKEAMMANVNVIENIIYEGIACGKFKKVDVSMLIATIIGTISNVVMYPFKIIPDLKLDLIQPEDHEMLNKRLIDHLKDLITTYLTPKNDTKNN